MTIGLISVISTCELKEYLFKESCDKASLLSSGYAPAVTTLALEWLRVGHKLVVFTLDPIATQKQVLRGENLTIYVAPARARTKFGRVVAPFGRDYFLLKSMLKENRIPLDVISAHWTRDYALVSLVYGKECPIFVTVRDIMPYIIRQIHGLKNYPWYITYLKNEVVMRNDRFNFIANSEYTAASVKKYWDKDIPVIPNPIDERFFSVTPEICNNDSTFSIVSISISSISDKRKNILVLLRAFKSIRRRYPECTLSLIGQCFTMDDPQVKKLHTDGMLEGVKLIGSLPHEEVVKYLAQADLMVHPSLEETFGNTLVEAMAAGCPVLGGENSGAVPYVLDFGRAGFLCDVTSVNDMATAIEHIIQNKPQRIEVAERAKRRCVIEYSSRHIAERYIELFNKAITHSC